MTTSQDGRISGPTYGSEYLLPWRGDGGSGGGGGGNWQGDGCSAGGAGGGAIVLASGGDVRLASETKILAKGSRPTFCGRRGGGGSGGAIMVYSAGVLNIDPECRLDASGGDSWDIAFPNDIDARFGTGGAGGRIAVYGHTDFQMPVGTAIALGGWGDPAGGTSASDDRIQRSAAGTVTVSWNAVASSMITDVCSVVDPTHCVIARASGSTQASTASDKEGEPGGVFFIPKSKE